MPETVILLHGIGHHFWNTSFAEKALCKAGYETLNLFYPSHRYTIETLAEWVKDEIIAAQVWERSSRLHFVSHSMGGLIAGVYLDKHRASVPAGKMGRVVMMGTPHGGSEVADFLHDNPFYRLILGPAGQELTTAARAAGKIKPWYDLGIIAGEHDFAPLFGLFCISGKHDGCVSIESTKLDGMKDHIVMPVLHGLMGWKPSVHKQVLYFLKNGEFEREQ